MAAPQVGANVDGAQLNNVGFNTDYFNTFCTRPVRSATICKSIQSNVLPALPLSKVVNKSMCMTYHTKGQYNGDCPRVSDHVANTAAEDVPLRDWCLANYPEGEGN